MYIEQVYLHVCVSVCMHKHTEQEGREQWVSEVHTKTWKSEF